MLLMCQEFNMNDTMRVWDTIFCAEPPTIREEMKIKRFTYINYIAVALVRGVRNPIVRENDFAVCMEMLQKASTPPYIGNIE